MLKTYRVISEWLNKTDSLGHKISSWCKPLNDSEVFCKVCQKQINCKTKGFTALGQHVSTKVHKENAAIKLASSQMIMKSSSAIVPSASEHSACTSSSKHSACTLSSTGSKISLFYSNEDVVRSELIWALKSVQCNLAATVNDDLNQVFSAMFPNTIAEKFQLGRTKLSYLITEALGPYFRNEMIYDIRQSKSFFSVLFDETTNNANKKELQFKIRYWSEETQEIACRHLQTVFLGHSTAPDVVSRMNDVFSRFGLPKQKLLMLGSDGPNVNKSIWALVNVGVIEARGHGLIDIGTCNLHVIHNAFLKGLEEYGETACDLVYYLYKFFKKYPSRWEDYEKSQFKKSVPKHRFIKHVSGRWLTAGPACERVIEQWPAIEDYFLIFLQQNRSSSSLIKTEKYKYLVKMIKFIDIKVELTFIAESADIYGALLKLLQRSEPLIHILCSELDILLKKIKGRICKSQFLSDAQYLSNEHLLKPDKVDCGDKTLVELKKLKESEQPGVFYKIQKHFLESHNYILEKSLLYENDTLEYLECLQEKNIKETRSLKYISKLCDEMPFIGIKTTSVRDEWRLLQNEKFNNEKVRIDHFWRAVFNVKTDLGVPKYPSLTILVKALLSLSHGNSDVERGFSISRNILSEDKSCMSERLLNDRLTMQDAVRKFQDVSKVPITKELLNLAYGARKSYQMYLDEKKRIEDEKKRTEEEKKQLLKEKEAAAKKEIEWKKECSSMKQSIGKLETKAKSIEKEKTEFQKSADELIEDASEKLKKAIKEKDFIAIRAAHSMIKGSLSLREKEQKKAAEESKINRLVNKRKNTLIEKFIVKKPATSTAE